MRQKLILSAMVFVLACCGKGGDEYDATGTFETTEVTVSSEMAGKITSFGKEEGDTVYAGETVVVIDTVQLYLSKLQLEKNASSIRSNKPEVSKQIAALREQLDKQKFERNRIEKLLLSKAATQKQLDDVNSAILVLERQISAQLSTLNNSVSSIDAQSSAVDMQIAQINDKLLKCKLTSPINGIILSKYAECGEMAMPGQPLFKVGDINNMILRAYVTSEQLKDIRLGDKVNVYADFGGDAKREYTGVVQWIASKAEFTPKSIQTPDERADMVYAVKINVKNDGFIKIGMYGEVKFGNGNGNKDK